MNLLQKVISTLRRKQTPLTNPPKQLFGGRLPTVIERIVQRIQNYFSVYNPPEYFENNQPSATVNEGIAIVCANGGNDSVSCNSVPEDEYQEQCDEPTTENNTVPPTDENEYNIVVTHTVVQDNLINVYSPVDPSNQIVSNLVVILEPSALKYSPPSEPVVNRNKFYIYVNPSAANKKKDNLQNKSDSEQNEKPVSFQPFKNATYTVILRGDKIEEYSSNIDNADNNSLNPEISTYIHSSSNTQHVKNKCKPGVQTEDCKSQLSLDSTEDVILSSRSAFEDAPNINLVLVPQKDRANKSCIKDTYNNAPIEYYILKPDDGSLSRPKPKNSTQSLQKSGFDTISATYLPPNISETKTESEKPTTSTALPTLTEQTTNRLPLLFNLFRKNQEEPR